MTFLPDLRVASIFSFPNTVSLASLDPISSHFFQKLDSSPSQYTVTQMILSSLLQTVWGQNGVHMTTGLSQRGCSNQAKRALASSLHLLVLSSTLAHTGCQLKPLSNSQLLTSIWALNETPSLPPLEGGKNCWFSLSIIFPVY